MIDPNTELFLKMADGYGIKVAPIELPDGSVVIEAQDKVDVHHAHKEIISARIGNLEQLIKQLEKISNPYQKNSIRKLRINEEIYKLETQLLDLRIEYMARDTYEQTYAGHVKRGIEVDRIHLEEFNNEMPLLVKLGYAYVQENCRPFTKEAALIAGHIAQHENGYKNDHEKLYTYQNMKALVNAVKNNQK